MYIHMYKKRNPISTQTYYFESSQTQRYTKYHNKKQQQNDQDTLIKRAITTHTKRGKHRRYPQYLQVFIRSNKHKT